DDGVLAIVVVEQGAAGPRLTELADALRASGFEDVLALDGDARSALADGHGAAHLEAEGLHDPRETARYGIGVRWAR
ncbi:MAG TPA: hypothetical protein PKA64_15350, partial [Myxococcota bacterium]|nr:hypothetical protein [Myxococcota bacterium]